MNLGGRRCLVGVVGVLSVVPVLLSAAAPGVPKHLRILSAQVESVGEIRVGRIKGRQAAVRIEVEEEPKCTAETLSLAYGILIDADRDTATGVHEKKALGNLGVDARVSAECDPARGEFSSRIGSVTVEETEQGTALIEILTTVDQLPSVDFDWIGYATEDGRLTRLPAGKRERGSWAIFEIRFP